MWINADPTWNRVTCSRWKMTRRQSFNLLCLPFQLHFAQLEQQCHSRLLPHESFSTTDTVHGTNATPLWRFATNKQRNSRVCLLEFLVYIGDRQKPVPTVDDHDDLLLWYWSMSTILRSNYIHCTAIMEYFGDHTTLLAIIHALFSKEHTVTRAAMLWCVRMSRYTVNGWVHWTRVCRLTVFIT